MKHQPAVRLPQDLLLLACKDCDKLELALSVAAVVEEDKRTVAHVAEVRKQAKGELNRAPLLL